MTEAITSGEHVFCCRKCRSPLFRPEHVMDTGKGASQSNSFFLQEALKWMEDASKDTESKLYCPTEGCTARVGSLNWVGVQIPGAGWVSPAIIIHKKAVDPRRVAPRAGTTAPQKAAAASAAAAASTDAAVVSSAAASGAASSPASASPASSAAATTATTEAEVAGGASSASAGASDTA